MSDYSSMSTEELEKIVQRDKDNKAAWSVLLYRQVEDQAGGKLPPDLKEGFILDKKHVDENLSESEED